MRGEKEITKRVTRVIKSADKLVQDIEKDVGQIIASVGGVKELIADFKEKFKPKDES